MVKGLKDENAPKRPLTAYIQWQNSVRDKVMASLPEGSSVAVMSKKFGEMWAALSDSAKAPFQKKFQAESEKYQKKLAKYKTTKEYAKFQKAKEQHKLDTVKKSKFKKDENAPTRPQSAYFLYMADERDELVASGLSHKEALSKIGEMWGNLSAAKKKPYQDKAAAAKAKYQKVVEKYRKTATYKKYLKEKDEFYANKKAELKKLDERQSRSRSKKPKAPKRSVSRSKSTKKSARKASKPKAPKRSVSRSKSRKASKGKKKSRSRSRSKAKKAKKKSRSRSRSKAKKAAKPAKVEAAKPAAADGNGAPSILHLGLPPRRFPLACCQRWSPLP